MQNKAKSYVFPRGSRSPRTAGFETLRLPWETRAPVGYRHTRYHLALQLALLLTAPWAGAQELSADRYQGGMDHRAIFSAEWATAEGPDAIDLQLGLGYAKDPLKYGGDALVSERFGFALSTAYSFSSAVQLGLQLPFVLYQDTAAAPALGLSAASSGGVGAVRLALKLRLFGDERFALAAIPVVVMPTSQTGAYSGESYPQAEPTLALSSTLGRLRAALNLGYRARRAVQLGADRLDDELFGDLGLSYRFSSSSPIQARLGLSMAAPLSSAGEQRAYWEGLFGLRYAPPTSRMYGELAAGLGLSDALGEPAHRVLLTVGFSLGPPPAPALAQPCSIRLDAPARAECPPLDPDKDGVPQPQDRCPEEAGPRENGGCPNVDSDADGLPDVVDRCPKAAEDKDGVDDADGCPETIPEDAAAAPASLPAPAAAAASPAPDAPPAPKASCPPTEGAASSCAVRPLAEVGPAQITTKKKLRFLSRRTKLTHDSELALADVAALLRAHPALKLRVEVFSDGRGKRRKKLHLTQLRAQVICKALIADGVRASRLEAVGRGPAEPLASDKTLAGREKNRRVVLRLVP